jgi:hypothetical protein
MSSSFFVDFRVRGFGLLVVMKAAVLRVPTSATLHDLASGLLSTTSVASAVSA